MQLKNKIHCYPNNSTCYKQSVWLELQDSSGAIVNYTSANLSYRWKSQSYVFCFNDVEIWIRYFLSFIHIRVNRIVISQVKFLAFFWENQVIAVRNAISCLKQYRLLRFFFIIGIPGVGGYWCKLTLISYAIRDPGTFYLPVLSFLAN